MIVHKYPFLVWPSEGFKKRILLKTSLPFHLDREGGIGYFQTLLKQVTFDKMYQQCPIYVAVVSTLRNSMFCINNAVILVQMQWVLLDMSRNLKDIPMLNIFTRKHFRIKICMKAELPTVTSSSSRQTPSHQEHPHLPTPVQPALTPVSHYLYIFTICFFFPILRCHAVCTVSRLT